MADHPASILVPSSTPIPRWITALDIALLLVLVVMLRSLAGDSYRISITPDLRLSLTSWLRLLGWFVVLLTIRLAVWRRVWWHTRVLDWIRRAWAWEPLRASLPVFIVSRLLVSAVAYAAVVTIGFDPPRPWRALENDLLDLYARWDAGWYFQIASVGYPPHFNPEKMNELAFFPGFPILMRGVGVLLDINRWLAGIVVVSIAFLWALTYMYRLALRHMAPDQAHAALMFLAFYPFAVCYSAILTEAVFLLAALGAFYHLGRRQLPAAAAFGLLAGFLRPNGFLLCMPLALMALVDFARHRGWLGTPAKADRPPWRGLAAALLVASLPIVGMVTYSAYVDSMIGDPLGWAKAQQAWGRSTWGILGFIEARRDLIVARGWSAYPRAYFVEIFEAAAALFALAAVWPVTRRFGLAYGLFVAMAVIPPFISMGSVSLGRYTAPLFPIFLWLGAAVPERHRPYWIAAFASGQALVAVLFFTWRAPY